MSASRIFRFDAEATNASDFFETNKTIPKVLESLEPLEQFYRLNIRNKEINAPGHCFTRKERKNAEEFLNTATSMAQDSVVTA